MSEATGQKVMKRGWVVVGAILIQLCLGAIYAWSVFTPVLAANDAADVAAVYSASRLGMDDAQLEAMRTELKVPKDELKKATAEFKKLAKSETDSPKLYLAEQTLEAAKAALVDGMDRIAESYKVKDKVDALKYGLSNAQTQGIFSAGLAAFAVVMVLAGRMMPKVGPRKLAAAGGVVLGLGYILAGVLNGTSFWPLFICIGLIGGAGIGLGYVVPIAVGMRWFPDKKGLITGLGVAGFGFGATLWITLAHKLGPLGGGHLLADIGISSTFIVYGIAYLVIVLLGSIWMVFPPQGWKPANWTPPADAKGGTPVAGTVDFTSSEMLRTPQFYMILFTFAFGASAGLMSVGLMNRFPSQVLQARGMDAQAASAAASLAMGVFFALMNGLGRIAWGSMSDKIGRKRSIIIMMVTQGLFVISFQWMAGNTATLYLFAMLIGFNFGGNFALFPTITADTFGTKHIGQNYGWVFLAYAIGGIFGPILGGMLGDRGNFPLAFTICGVLCLVAAALITGVKHPRKHALEPAGA